MLPEEKILRNILANENVIDIHFRLKAFEALRINNVFDLEKFVKHHNINADVDITKTLEENKERVYYALNEEFYKIREKSLEGE